MKVFTKIILFSLLNVCFLTTAYAADPTTQANNLTITNRTDDVLSLSWTRGNGEYCLVVLKPFANSYAYPQDLTTSPYSASSTYGAGSNLGSSNYVVYRGTGTSVSISNLSPSTQYMAVVYEYNTTNIFCTDYYY